MVILHPVSVQTSVANVSIPLVDDTGKRRQAERSAGGLRLSGFESGGPASVIYLPTIGTTPSQYSSTIHTYIIAI
jgi:hypothetical protein